MTRALPLVTLLLVAAAGCADDPAMTDSQPTGAHYQYVVDQIDMPQTANEANQLGLNLDRDSAGRPDNALGVVLASVIGAFPEYDLDAEADAQIGDGTITTLFDLQTTDLSGAPDVGLELLHGRDLDSDPSDNDSGNEFFAIDPSRGSGLLTGDIINGQLDVGYGSVPVAFTFPGLGEAFVVTLDDARVVARVDVDQIAGVIGGGMSQRTIDDEFVPALQRGFDNIVARDCPDGAGSCTSDFAATLLDMFDAAPFDGRLSVDELRDSPLISALLSPDIDVDGDGAKDHLSVGLGFTAVSAVIQP